MKKTWGIIFTVLLVLGTVVGGTSVSANKLQELENQKKEITEKSSEVKSEMAEKEKELEEIQNKQEDLKQEIKQLDMDIQSISEDISNKTQEIEKKNEEIAQLNEEIKELEARIKKRDELLMERARAIQASGGTISYLEVLLGAKSFTDFISRVSAVSAIIEADKMILEEHKKDRDSLEEKKELVEQDKKKLEQLKEQLQSQKNQLESKRVEKDQVMEQLKEEEGAIEEYYMDLKEQQELLAAQEAAIKKAMELEKKRIEEEKRRLEEAKKNGTVPPSSGMFMRPAAGQVTSEFGARWGTTHYGIDIGATTRGVAGDPVYAAAAGVVSKSYYSPSYGNVIFITHYIDGQVYTTVYAHLLSRGVSEGQIVNKGDVIGKMGTTGYSTGVHLHFELHVGEWNYAKSNAVNPRKYINF
ncbi:murein hydrolase activator EnvC family protein [Fervidibacillus halotolerans]|uniref:Peptidoglycan DD-metalloendopeptidase family protein n=1 Tax=Fervidibacillus halotolerans TaxID=2980027 RepID=A0A9E8LYP8_9BACI|nr:peptidoglycan DD-metalloendopeptidase family protein [Fervidibacillus halotolerans]WAA12006.1 peptidoglycan DD-metalloendopeptidase family protein [Fervidibacillus halotolerans]